MWTNGEAHRLGALAEPFPDDAILSLPLMHRAGMGAFERALGGALAPDSAGMRAWSDLRQLLRGLDLTQYSSVAISSIWAELEHGERIIDAAPPWWHTRQDGIAELLAPLGRAFALYAALPFALPTELGGDRLVRMLNATMRECEVEDAFPAGSGLVGYDGRAVGLIPAGEVWFLPPEVARQAGGRGAGRSLCGLLRVELSKGADIVDRSPERRAVKVAR